jgi:glutamate synthase domain-containing protein 1
MNKRIFTITSVGAVVFVAIFVFFTLATHVVIAKTNVFANAKNVESELVVIEKDLGQSVKFWRQVLQQSSARKNSARDENISSQLVNSLTVLKNEITVARKRLENVRTMKGFTSAEIIKATAMAKETRDRVFRKLVALPVNMYNTLSPAPEKFFKPR